MKLLNSCHLTGTEGAKIHVYRYIVTAKKIRLYISIISLKEKGLIYWPTSEAKLNIMTNLPQTT